ncbi:hypothetical protein GCM10022199_06120 [Marihabitans asiaticum]
MIGAKVETLIAGRIEQTAASAAKADTSARSTAAEVRAGAEVVEVIGGGPVLLLNGVQVR